MFWTRTSFLDSSAIMTLNSPKPLTNAVVYNTLTPDEHFITWLRKIVSSCGLFVVTRKTNSHLGHCSLHLSSSGKSGRGTFFQCRSFRRYFRPRKRPPKFGKTNAGGPGPSGPRISFMGLTAAIEALSLGSCTVLRHDFSKYLTERLTVAFIQAEVVARLHSGGRGVNAAQSPEPGQRIAKISFLVDQCTIW